MKGDDTVIAFEWLNGLSVSEINFTTTYTAKAESYPMTNNSRNHHGFIYTVKGTERYIFEDRTVVATPNSVLYLPKGSKYKITLEGEESVVIYVDFELYNSSLHAPFCIMFDEDKTVQSLFSDAEKYWSRKNFDWHACSKSIFYKICSHIIRKSESYMSSEGYSKIADSVNYLHRHYTENDFKVEKLYEIAKISSRYYEKLFYRKFSKTPKEYIVDLKIECAKELLLQEKSLIKDVALKLGYNDIYHFGKIFKKKTGYTPSQFRQMP